MSPLIALVLMVNLVPQANSKPPKAKEATSHPPSPSPSRSETVEYVLDKLNADELANGGGIFKWEFSDQGDLVQRWVNKGWVKNIPLKSLSSIDLEGGKGEVPTWISFKCSNGSKCIAFSGGNDSSDLMVVFKSRDTAERVSKALRHLRELESGKKELF